MPSNTDTPAAALAAALRERGFSPIPTRPHAVVPSYWECRNGHMAVLGNPDATTLIIYGSKDRLHQWEAEYHNTPLPVILAAVDAALAEADNHKG